jgi:hypothetical protein
MDINSAIRILEMLAAGCSPATGELISDESVLNERDVIRALQIAIDNLKKDAPVPGLSINNSSVEIEEEDIKAAIHLFLEQDNAPTENRLTGFFLASRSFKNAALISNKLYGKYKRLYTKGQLQDFFADYLAKRGYLRNIPWENIDFFQKETFNDLSGKDINELKERINELGVTKTDNLADYVKVARKNYPRAYEPWNETEKQLLDEALKRTNDIEILTQCFQRGEGAIVSCGKKLIYERKPT